MTEIRQHILVDFHMVIDVSISTCGMIPQKIKLLLSNFSFILTLNFSVISINFFKLVVIAQVIRANMHENIFWWIFNCNFSLTKI